MNERGSIVVATKNVVVSANAWRQRCAKLPSAAQKRPAPTTVERVLRTRDGAEKLSVTAIRAASTQEEAYDLGGSADSETSTVRHRPILAKRKLRTRSTNLTACMMHGSRRFPAKTRLISGTMVTSGWQMSFTSSTIECALTGESDVR